MFSNADEVLKYVRDEGVEMIDVRFCDLPGIMQHFSIPASSFDESVFSDGVMFDGSSIRGFQAIHESDMSLLPGPDDRRASTRSGPPKTLNLNFFIHDPLTGEPYSRDPRNIARKAETYLNGTGIADTSTSARGRVLRLRRRALRDEGQHRLLLDRLDRRSLEHRPVEDGGNRGYKVRYKGGYFPVPPVDHFADLRAR
jgi:glutamine synthetase